VADVERINSYLQRYLKANGLYHLSAVDAARALGRAGLLPDSESRPGLPLRKLLRNGRIRGAAQEANGRWFIRRASAAGSGPGISAVPALTAASTAAQPRPAGAPAPVLPDVLRPALAVVFVGESAGETSAREGQYYAGSGNSFWSELAAVGITERELKPHEFRRLPEYGIGLTDILKHLSDAKLKKMTRREWSDAIRAAAGNLGQRVGRVKPEAVCLVGLRPGREVGRHLFGWDRKPARCAGAQLDSRLGEAQVWLCPSTSAAARAMASLVRAVFSDLCEQVVRPWQERNRRAS